MNPRPTLFIFITEGFRIRSLLYSDVLPQLKARYRVVIIVPPADVERIRAHFGDGDAVVVEARPDSPLRLESKFTFVRRHLISNPARNRTISVFSSLLRKEQPFNYWVMRLVNPWLGRLSPVRRAWLAFEAAVNRGDEYGPLFERYRPALVVTTDYGSQVHEIRLLRQARRRGVRSVSVVYSWDNLSSKGVMGAVADRLIVWSEIMRREAEELHDIPGHRVDICGAAQFDVYGRPAGLRSREEFCRRMRLDPTRPIVTLGTITPRFFPTNLEIAQILVDAIRSGDLPRECQLLIRLHPQVINKGVAADDLGPYRAFEAAHEGVRLNVPETVVWGSLASPAPDDGQVLAEILRHSAVLIHPGSTLAVDAAAMDCPVIGLGFDGFVAKPYGESIRRWWDFTYMQAVVRSGGQPIARDRPELLALVRRYLEDRSVDRDGRARLRDAVAFRIDGQSAERVVSCLALMIEDAPSVRSTTTPPTA